MAMRFAGNLTRALRQSLWVCVWLAAPLAAADTASLEIQPSTIAVSPSYAEVQADAILKNSGTVALDRLQLSFLTNDGLTIQIGKPSSPNAQPNQTVVWRISIKAPSAARLPASALFESKYSLAGQGTCYRAFASLTVTSQQDSKVTASIDGSFDAISSQRPGVGSLTLTNDFDFPVHVAIQSLGNPAVMTISPIPPTDVPGRSTINLPIEVRPVSKITPGTYSIALEVTATWTWGGGREERRMVVSKPGTFGIFFESELLKALGIPSFLLLPGCLMIFTAQLLLAFNVWGVKNESSLPDLGITNPGFWVIAITLSGLFALIYIWRTGTNYLVRYGPQDLIAVWGWSVLTGAVLYLILGWWRWRFRRRRVPEENDQPLDILRKMARNGIGVNVPEVRFSMGNNQWRGFVIENLSESKTKLWVTPPMLMVWDDQADAQTQLQVNTDLNLAGQPNPAEAPATILERIARQLGANAAQVKVRWDMRGAAPSIPYPYHVKADSITQYLNPGRILT